MEVCPEVVGDGRDESVFVCSYTDVFPVAHILQQQYIKFKEEGDVGEYKKMVKQLMGILDKIMKRTDAIDRAAKAITNASEEIKDQVSNGKRL